MYHDSASLLDGQATGPELLNTIENFTQKFLFLLRGNFSYKLSPDIKAIKPATPLGVL